MASKDEQTAVQPPPSYNPQYGQQQGYQQPGMMQPPVVAQPAQSTTTAVIVSGGNQGQAPQNVRNWSTGLCGCCSDCGSCCFAYWCWPCFLCNLSSEMGEDCCGPFFCGFPFLGAMRTKVRTMYGIRGSICGDLCVTYWCAQCAMCQLSRELKFNGGYGNQAQPTVTVANVATR